MRAIVTSPVCPLHVQPRGDSPLADEALYGMVVEVLEQTTPGYWKVRTHYRYEGYAPVRCLVIGDEAAQRWEALPKKVVLQKNFCDVMADSAVQSFSLITLPRGAVVSPEGEPEEDWQYVTLPDGGVGYVRESALDDYHATPLRLPERQLRQRICDTALLYLGTSYRWGGKTPLGIDCSGLTSMSYLLNGIVIYRDARLMDGFPIRPIRREELKPADLLYFPGHIALYLGNGKYIHATGKAGSDGVVINSLDPASPDYREDLDKSLIAAGTYF